MPSPKVSPRLASRVHFKSLSGITHLNPKPASREPQKELWEALFSKPWEWWDNRSIKDRSHGFPDFCHRVSGEALWLDSTHKPPWVDSRLLSLPQVPNAGANVRAICRAQHLHMALCLLFHKSIVDASLPVDFYLVVLRSCSQEKALFQTRLVHDHIYRRKLELTGSLGDQLVTTLAKCGALDDASHLFFSLPYHTVFSWTALIVCYTDCGKGQAALKLYHLMQQECVEPNQFTFAGLLKACASIQELHEGEKLHAEAQRKGFVCDVFVGSTLVRMYGKCGNILEAEKVFDGLSERNIVSWNAMLTAYTEHGEEAKALKLYRQMQEEQETPNQHSLAATLHACGSFAYKLRGGVKEGSSLLHVGQALHADARRRGFILDLFIRSTLVTMYGYCGVIAQAVNVFNGPHQCDIICWSAMLSIHVEQGQGVNALRLYRQMLEEGFDSDHQVFVIAIQACSVLVRKEAFTGEAEVTKTLSIGQALNADAKRKAFLSSVFIGNALISMFGKLASSIVQAERVFNGLSDRNVVSWTAMVSIYVEHGLGKKALQLYRQMQEQGVNPNQLTFVVAFQACSVFFEEEEHLKGTPAVLMALEIGTALHAQTFKQRFTSDVFVGNALVSMYKVCGTIREAEHMFHNLLQHDTVSWNAMLSAYMEHGQGEKALLLYQQMQKEGFSPDQLTYVVILQACCALSRREEEGEDWLSNSLALEIGQAIHADAQMEGFKSNVMVCNTLLSMYGKCGDVSKAMNIFDEMLERDVVSWNAMISALCEVRQGEEALCLFRQMEEEVVVPDEVTFVCILQACSEVGNLEICRQLHYSFMSSICDPSLLLQHTLIHAYGSSASMEDAQAVFDELTQPDTTSWNVCVAGYAQEGDDLASIQMVDEMQFAGFKPNEVTFLSILSVCTYAGLLSKGIQYFESMTSKNKIIRNAKHYAVMTGLLGHTGELVVIENMLMGMPIQANLAVWLCLMGVCQIHRNTQVGKLAFDNVVCSGPKDAVAYVLMANICSDAGWQGHAGVTGWDLF